MDSCLVQFTLPYSCHPTLTTVTIRKFPFLRAGPSHFVRRSRTVLWINLLISTVQSNQNFQRSKRNPWSPRLRRERGTCCMHDKTALVHTATCIEVQPALWLPLSLAGVDVSTFLQSWVALLPVSLTLFKSVTGPCNSPHSDLLLHLHRGAACTPSLAGAECGR